MGFLFKIYNKNYWASIFSPILTFVIPVVWMWLISTIFLFSNNGQYISLNVVLTPTALFTSLYVVLVLSLPQAVFEIKDSVLIKMLKTSSIKKWQILLVGVLYYSVAALISYIISLLISLIYSLTSETLRQTIFWMYTQVNWGCLIYVLFVNLILGASFGIMIASLTKTSSVIYFVGILVILLSIVLCGFGVPILIARDQMPFLWLLGYFDFIHYGVASSYEAMFASASTYNLYNSNIFDFSTKYVAMITGIIQYPFEVYYPYDKVLNIFLPFFMSIGFVAISFRSFKI